MTRRSCLAILLVAALCNPTPAFRWGTRTHAAIDIFQRWRCQPPLDVLAAATRHLQLDGEVARSNNSQFPDGRRYSSWRQFESHRITSGLPVMQALLPRCRSGPHILLVAYCSDRSSGMVIQNARAVDILLSRGVECLHL
jgi:hypothetical protein